MISIYLNRVLSSTFIERFCKIPLSRVTRSCCSFDKFFQNVTIFLCICIEIKRINFFMMVMEKKPVNSWLHQSFGKNYWVTIGICSFRAQVYSCIVTTLSDTFKVRELLGQKHCSKIIKILSWFSELFLIVI